MNRILGKTHGNAVIESEQNTQGAVEHNVRASMARVSKSTINAALRRLLKRPTEDSHG